MATHVGVLPDDVLQALCRQYEDTVSAGQFIRLPHPRTGIPALFYPVRGSNGAPVQILEVQQVAPPSARSWFIGDSVLSDGKLLLMTPMDPTFLLFPILRSLPETGAAFRPSDDIFEDAANILQADSQKAKEAELRLSTQDIFSFTSAAICQEALKHLCGVQEITPELMVYRYSAEKALNFCRKKVAIMAESATFEISRSLVRSAAKDGLMEDGKDELLQLARIRGACDTVSQYLPHDVREALIQSYDFSSLDAYLKTLETPDALAATNGKNKAGENGEDSKKRKTAGKDSTGVAKLKKVNTKGMAKLSSFFVKKA